MKSCGRSLLRWRSRDQSKGSIVSSQVGLGLVFSLFRMWSVSLISPTKIWRKSWLCHLIIYIDFVHLVISICIPSAFDSVFFSETCQAEKGVLEQKLEDSKKEVPLQHCMSDWWSRPKHLHNKQAERKEENLFQKVETAEARGVEQFYSD